MHRTGSSIWLVRRMEEGGACHLRADVDLPDLALMMLATRCRIGGCLVIGWDEVDLDRRR